MSPQRRSAIALMRQACACLDGAAALLAEEAQDDSGYSHVRERATSDCRASVSLMSSADDLENDALKPEPWNDD